MWTQKFCLICIYILRNYAFQISNEALFLAFLQPGANRLKSFILPSNRMGKTSSASTFNKVSIGFLQNGADNLAWKLPDIEDLVNMATVVSKKALHEFF